MDEMKFNLFINKNTDLDLGIVVNVQFDCDLTKKIDFTLNLEEEE